MGVTVGLAICVKPIFELGTDLVHGLVQFVEYEGHTAGGSLRAGGFWWISGRGLKGL